MKYILPDGQIIGRKDFTLNGKKHRSNVLDKAASLESLGILAVEEQTGYDINADGSYTPKWTLEELRTRKTAAIKAEAYRLLQPTDWYAIRKAETDEAIPQAVADYREAVRLETDGCEAQLAGIDDYDTMLAFEPEWPEEG